MFGHLPSRSKNDCHSSAADFHYDMTRKRGPPMIRTCSSDYFNSPRRSEDPWDRAYPRSSPFGMDPFRSERDLHASYPQRSNPLDIRYSSGYNDHSISFEKAAADLYAVLEHADKELQTMHKTFTTQISGLSLWLPQQYADLLWTIYTDWDGQPVDSGSTKTPKLTNLTPTTFHTFAKRFAKASDALKQSAPPSSSDNNDFAHSWAGFSSSFPDDHTTFGHSWSWDNIRTTLRKLYISLDAIDELVGGVRQQRQRMGSLVREIVGAKQLLEGMKEVWDVPPVRKGKEKKEGERKYDWNMDI